MGQAQRLGRPRGRRAVHHGGDRAGQGVGAVAVEGLGRLPLPRSPAKAGAQEPEAFSPPLRPSPARAGLDPGLRRGTGERLCSARTPQPSGRWLGRGFREAAPSLGVRPMRLVLLAAAACIAMPALAQVGTAIPQPLPMEAAMPAPRDVPYPGTLRLEVDASDTSRGIYRVVETIPVAGPGPLTLLYPEWLPGNHGPRGPINSIAGLRITANGRPVEWRRDSSYVYAFHVDVPEGARSLRVEFQHLSPTDPGQGRVTMTPNMLNLQWEKMSLYPAGYFTRGIPIEAVVAYPAGWSAATSLDVAARAGNRLTYRTVPYETLVDSPVFAGRYYRRERLTENINLNLFADEPGDLAATPEQIAIHRRAAEQEVKLFGTVHFDEYEYLVALTDELGGIGLEHLRSSENSHPRDYFTDWNSGSAGRDLLTHAFTHSWNGKYRRPADLWTPNYNVPMRDSLLWVYEGQTQFWGNILAARSGLTPTADVLDG